MKTWKKGYYLDWDIEQMNMKSEVKYQIILTLELRMRMEE